MKFIVAGRYNLNNLRYVDDTVIIADAGSKKKLGIC